jgi:hypothetical protein
MIVLGVDDHGVLQREPLHDLGGQIDVDHSRVTDLDADQSAVPGHVQQTGDLESAQAELARDLDLGALVQVVPARHEGCASQGGGPHELSGHGKPPAQVSAGFAFFNVPLDVGGVTANTSTSARTRSYVRTWRFRTSNAGRRRCPTSSPCHRLRCRAPGYAPCRSLRCLVAPLINSRCFPPELAPRLATRCSGDRTSPTLGIWEEATHEGRAFLRSG